LSDTPAHNSNVRPLRVRVFARGPVSCVPDGNPTVTFSSPGVIVIVGDADDPLFVVVVDHAPEIAPCISGAA